MTVNEEKLADNAVDTTLIGSQPVSRFSTTRGSMRKRGSTKPVKDEEGAPVSALNTMFPKKFATSRQPVSLLFTFIGSYSSS